MQKNKIFQDSTQGYISVPEKYVLKLIDTEEVQRLKDVSQTGLRALYSGATHDRFSHSMGVYHIGCQIYDSFIDNISQALNKEQLKKIKKLLDEWRELFHVACLLHDIGHPAFLHTLEFLLNSPYVCIDMEKQKNSGIKIDSDEINRFYKRFLNASPSDKNKRYLKVRLLSEIRKKEENADFIKFHNNESLEVYNPAPHEMLGAYLILTDTNLQERIKKVYGKDFKDEYFAFIARMITGIEYDPISNKYSFELSLRNCVIGLLNGKIDADSIDYLNRNSHFAGYATSKLDLTRLCNSFSAYFDKKREVFIPCLKKSALSTLDSFTSARNFEPKWLYSHHKIVYYNDFLIKFLVKMCGQYIFALRQKNWEKAIVECLKDSECEFYGNSNGNKVSKLVLAYFDSGHKQLSSYNSWKDFFEKELSNKRKRNSITDKLLNSKRDSALTVINGIGLEDSWTSYTRHELLDFFVGILIYYSNKIFELYEMYPTDNEFVIEACDDFIIIIDFLRSINDMFARLRVSCTDYFFSPQAYVSLKVKDGETYEFGFCSDAHFRKLFLDFGNKFPTGSDMPEELFCGNKVEDVRRQYRHKLFTEVLEEFKTRNLRQSLWKTYEEYNIFINSLAEKCNISVKTLKDELQELIKSGYIIDFEDVIATAQEMHAKGNNKKIGDGLQKYEHIYTNYPNYPESYKFIRNEKEFDSVFGFLGEGLVIRFYSCKFKNFSQIPIQFENDVYKYGEVVKMLIPENFTFPYIYFRADNSATKNKKEILDKLGENLKKYIINKISGREGNMGNSNFDTGKIIRDSVHGDIFVPNKFLKIIDCKAFQRLHRIKQLATADMIFPEAVHTRFAHSLGTFHITNLMMNHFCEILNELKIDCPQAEKDAILVAALLHDLGHGPYSHAYEHIGEKKKSHEEWTKEIIKKDAELSKVLENEFGYGFTDKIIACLDKSLQNNGNYSLTNIFTEIISSNLDADRMDYLMRDAYNTGVKFGVFDLQKLISSMELVEREGKAKIALRIDSVPAIEQFMFGRYNMYSEVYFAPYKLALEKILKIICARIDESNYNKESDLFKLFHNAADIQTYLTMDDYSFMNGIENFAKAGNDVILKYLLESFKTRGGFKRIRMSDADAKNFIDYWKKQFPYAERIKYGVIFVGKDFKAYEADDNEILVVKDNGIVKNFSEVSRLYGKQNEGKTLWHTLTGYIYYNEEILKHELDELEEDIDIEKTINELKMLFEKYDANKHTEIENKYDCSSISIENAKKVQTVFKNSKLKGFKQDGELYRKAQIDIYYDTKNFLLAQHKYSLRCRKDADNGNIFTIKKPGETVGDNKQAQFIRSEFEEKRQSDNIKEAQNLFDEHLAKNLKNITGTEVTLDELIPVVKIVNDRVSYYVTDDDKESGFKCEVSLDSIRYIDYNSNKEETDNQIEIELKCKYPYRLRMNKFAEIFCEIVGVSGNSRAKESKYLKALTSLNLI